MIRSQNFLGWCLAILGVAAGGLIGGAMVWFVFRGGRSGVSTMTGLVGAGAIAGLSLGAVVGIWWPKQHSAVSDATGDWRDAFRRR